MILRRQNLAEHGIQAIEENLGHAPQRECVGQCQHVLAAVRIQVGERRGCGGQQHHRDSDSGKQRDRESDELIEPVLSVILLQRAHNLRNQHRVENTAGNKAENHLGNHRTGLIGVCRHTGRADCRGEENGTDLAGQSRSGRTDGHDEGIMPY